MLFLLFQLGKDRYALDASQVAEVLPLVNIKKLPQSPPGIAGAFSYRGTPTPVLDLSEFALGKPAQARLSTRLILVHYPTHNGKAELLGLIAEKATETLRRDVTEFTDAGVTNDNTPYLGPVTTDSRGIIQWIELNRLLP